MQAAEDKIWNIGLAAPPISTWSPASQYAWYIGTVLHAEKGWWYRHCWDTVNLWSLMHRPKDVNCEEWRPPVDYMAEAVFMSGREPTRMFECLPWLPRWMTRDVLDMYKKGAVKKRGRDASLMYWNYE